MTRRIRHVAESIAASIVAFVLAGAIGITSFCHFTAFSLQNWTTYGLCEGTNSPREVFLVNGLLFFGPILLVIYVARHSWGRNRRGKESSLPEYWKNRT